MLRLARKRLFYLNPEEAMSFLLPYISNPMVLMLIWRKWHLPAKGLSFLITILLLMLYPSILIKVDAYYHPAPIGEGECLMLETFITLAHFIIMIPITLIFQLILFAVFVRQKLVGIMCQTPQRVSDT